MNAHEQSYLRAVIERDKARGQVKTLRDALLSVEKLMNTKGFIFEGPTIAIADTCKTISEALKKTEANND